MMQRLAHVVEIDHQQGALTIDGEVFPYAIAPSPTASGVDDFIGIVSLDLYADEVVVTTKHGERHTTRYANQAVELAWARREARRIVLEGMADIIQNLWEAIPVGDRPNPGEALGLSREQAEAVAFATDEAADAAQGEENA